MTEPAILTAIDENDLASLKRWLKADPSLSHFQAREARLYRTCILHWIYVGDTPLHLASAGYRVEMAKLLLAAGADPNSTGNHRRSGPLHYAADSCVGSPRWDPQKQVATIQCLLKAGARIDAQDKNGAAPLHRAVRTRGAEAVRCLLNAGADPLLKNKPGSTPFHLAVQNTGRGGSGLDGAKAGQRQIIEIFLARGISVHLKDANGKSVLDWAKSEWIRELLEGYSGADGS